MTNWNTFDWRPILSEYSLSTCGEKLPHHRAISNPLATESWICMCIFIYIYIYHSIYIYIHIYIASKLINNKLFSIRIKSPPQLWAHSKEVAKKKSCLYVKVSTGHRPFSDSSQSYHLPSDLLRVKVFETQQDLGEIEFPIRLLEPLGHFWCPYNPVAQFS